MKKQIIIIGIMLMLLAVGLSGCNEKESIDTSTTTPSIQFKDDDIANTLTVTAVNPSGVLWSHIRFDGHCDRSGLGTYVVVGDVISHCYGSIAIYHGDTPLRGFSFSPTPSIQFESYTRTLTVITAYAPDTSWSDIDIIGSCDTSGLNGDIRAGDRITNCYGTIAIRHIPTNLLLGEYDFPE